MVTISALNQNLACGGINMVGLAQISVSLSTWKAIEAQRLSFDEDHDSIIRRALLLRASQKRSVLHFAARPDRLVTRKRGDLAVEVKGRKTDVANLKQAYITILAQLVKVRPSLFQSLLAEGNDRRRWIALSPEALFPLSPHLARQHAHRLTDTWFLDTNLSKAQIETRVERASELAGLKKGESARIIEG
jgi:hypothetical protein